MVVYSGGVDCLYCRYSLLILPLRQFNFTVSCSDVGVPLSGMRVTAFVVVRASSRRNRWGFYAAAYTTVVDGLNMRRVFAKE